MALTLSSFFSTANFAKDAGDMFKNAFADAKDDLTGAKTAIFGGPQKLGGKSKDKEEKKSLFSFSLSDKAEIAKAPDISALATTSNNAIIEAIKSDSDITEAAIKNLVSTKLNLLDN